MTMKKAPQAEPQAAPLLTLDEAIRTLGISAATMHRVLKRGDLRALKVGRRWRFRREDLMAYLERQAPAVNHSALPEMEAEYRFFAREGGVAAAEPEAPQQWVEGVVHGILASGVQAGASDIHLQPSRAGLEVRLRVDGVLHLVRTMPERIREPVTHQLKTLAGINTEERRVPQDGRIRWSRDGHDYDLRVAVMPTTGGESLVLRILDRGMGIVRLDDMGLETSDLAEVHRWLKQPNGLILVTGPTGSGKTTVLYSCLLEVANPANKVISIEDPVEYLLPNVVQTHVDVRGGLTFPVGLRAMMRHDPDVLMVGELRDREMTELAHQAAITGHLVLSSLPTSSVAGAIVRLLDIGIEPFMVTQSLLGITAQRLVRRVCPHCREKVSIPPSLLSRVRKLAAAGGYEIPRRTSFTRGRGCRHCRGRGFRGRAAIFEVMRWTPGLSDATLRRASEGELQELAVQGGMTSLWANGVRKAVAGVTSLDELLRIIPLP